MIFLGIIAVGLVLLRFLCGSWIGTTLLFIAGGVGAVCGTGCALVIGMFLFWLF